jgi:hypothetical protein
VKANQVIGLLKAKFALPEWALLEQVANGTGARAKRWADAVAINLWPSRGCEVHGFEVKVSRGDWLAEMKNPAKAEEVASYCDRWWLTIGDGDIVRSGELPSAWGLLAPDGRGGLAVVKEPAKIEPAPLSRGFVASVLRRATRQLTTDAMLREVADAAVAAAREEWEEERKEERERRSDWYRTLKADVDSFEAASGISITGGWHGPDRIGAAVKAYLSNPESFLKQARNLATQIQNLADSAANTVREMEGKPPRGAF